MKVGSQPEVANAVRWAGLDHLRTLAILLVFLFHYQIPIFGHPEWLPPLAKFGWTGVDLFFVLSGFLIAYQVFYGVKNGHGVGVKAFFIKRFFRILPAFWVVVALYFSWSGFHERERLLPAWRYLTFTQNFGLDLREYGTFSHAWSLCVEEHFYGLLPLIIVPLIRFKQFSLGGWLLLLLFAAGFCTRLYSWFHFCVPAAGTEGEVLCWYKYMYYPTYNRLDGLLAGVAIAALYHFKNDWWQRIAAKGNLWLVLGLLTLTAAYFLCYDEHTFYASVFGFPVVAIGYAMLVVGAVSPVSVLHKVRSKATALIATLSYGIYLTHKGVVHIAQNVFGAMGIAADSGLMLVLCMAACIAAAALLYLLVEKPMLNLRSRFLR